MEREQAVSSVLVDDARVRVTRFDFAPGAETGWHRHGLDYVITPITDCHMRLELPGGEVKTSFAASGEAYRRQAGIEHNVVNAGDTRMSFIEIELK